MRANVIKPTHLCRKKNSSPSPKTSNTPFHQTHWTSQFQIINRSAFNYFTHYSSSPRTQIQKLQPYFKKVFLPELFHSLSLLDCGNQTPVHPQTILTLSYATTMRQEILGTAARQALAAASAYTGTKMAHIADC